MYIAFVDLYCIECYFGVWSQAEPRVQGVQAWDPHSLEGGLIRQPTLRGIRSDRIKVSLLHKSGNKGQVTENERYIGGFQTV